MALHDGPCPKRTVMFSSMATISTLDLGPLTKAERRRRTSLQTVRGFDALTKPKSYQTRSQRTLQTSGGQVDSSTRKASRDSLATRKP